MIAVFRLRLFLFLALLGFMPAAAIHADKVYVVQSGDTLGQIAQQHGVRTADIQQYNNLTHPDRLQVGQPLRIPPGPDAPVRYIVKPGDTISHIARDHGVTAAVLIEYNKIANPQRLSIGQELLIPGRAAPARTALPATLQRDLDRVRVKPRQWKNIVIHHSGTPKGNARDMDRYHREQRRMVNGLAYHFVIGNGQGMGDGEIVIGHRWRGQLDGGHLASEAQNQVSIGICLVGNFDVNRPTARQMESLRALVQYLQRRCNIGKGAVRTHRQINVRPTNCPGRHFPMEQFLQGL